MNAALRDIGSRLRRACAEQAFGGAVAPLREWSNDMAAPAAALPETAAMPSVPDVRGLVDPLADSALAPPSLDPAPAKGDALEPSESERHASFPGPRKRASIASRPATASGTVPTLAKPRKDATCDPAQVASLLARHDCVSAGSTDSKIAGVRAEPAFASARNVVQLSPRPPAGEAAAHVEKTRSSPAMASTIARWNELMAAGARDRRENPDVVTERSAWQSAPSPDVPYVTGVVLDAAMRSSRELADVEAIRPDAMLRLSDMTDLPLSQRAEPNATQRPDPIGQAAAMSGTGSLDDSASAGAPERGSLGRVFDSLARIEEQVAARAPHAEPMTQWYDDDDGLAGRIHDILRRQVERHGIDLS